MTTVITKWINNVWFNEHNKFGKSISINLIDEPSLKELVEKNNVKVREVNDKKYVNFKFMDDFKTFDINNNEIKFDSDMFRNSETKFAFLVKQYNYKGKNGISVKICQVKFKPKCNIYDNSLFV